MQLTATSTLACEPKPAARLVVTLTPRGDGPPAELRFRRALKFLGRQCGLRAKWRPEPGEFGTGVDRAESFFRISDKSGAAPEKPRRAESFLRICAQKGAGVANAAAPSAEQNGNSRGVPAGHGAEHRREHRGGPLLNSDGTATAKPVLQAKGRRSGRARPDETLHPKRSPHGPD
jgi:hypothetical protein